MIRLLIVDDQTLIRAALVGLLDAQDDIDVVREATNGREGIAAARELRPDVVLMDIRMPELDGIAATTEICADPDLAAVRVLILTTFEDDENVVRALRAGASGFIGKGAEPDAIVQAIRSVHQGESLLSPAATRALIDRFVGPPTGSWSDGPSATALAELTAREREVLLLVATGQSNTDIAESLVISPLTAKTHVNRVMAKLQAHDRAQLVITAYESGLVRAGDAATRAPRDPTSSSR
ncbi:response regulator transcription factor [Plantibacter sp. YIM 135347]|jgi:DNA-binding NarL/FixJ family response regulator|uniref:response regulator transcription factor n=1 Tax=Plantibacter sp. YIM 135347 TaxID=3423919 RepID=UPI003D3274DC